MPWRPSQPGEVPTLGWYVIDWMIENLAAPDRMDYEPFVPTTEQAAFLLRFYAINPRTGKRAIRRGVISRPRGWGKSPFLSAICIAEGLADVVPCGWDANGQPVGEPWVNIRTPLVQVAAVSEHQTNNSWLPLLEMCQGPLLVNYPGVEPMQTFVNLPRGKIEPITASATSTKGNKAVFACLDQTEEWTRSNGGVRLATVMRINAGKLGGSTIESPNAYTPGVGSVAEESAEFYKSMIEGKARDDGLLYDHREAPPETDLADKVSLLSGLGFAYGDSAEPSGGWVDLDRIVAEIWDPNIDAQTSRADWLNQITHASDSWLTQPEWAACAKPAEIIADGDTITLGFDGSRRREKGTTDATALIGCRVLDGHLFEVGVWEQPDGQAGANWMVPTTEVDAAVRSAFDRFNVVGFYADPALWESFVATWEATWHKQLTVKSSRPHPIEWWMTGGRSVVVSRALEQFASAVIDGDLSHDGSFVLTRHVLNARRRNVRNTIQIAKEHRDSTRKIDAAVAAVLAWTARLDAVAAGVGAKRRTRKLTRF